LAKQKESTKPKQPRRVLNAKATKKAAAPKAAKNKAPAAEKKQDNAEPMGAPSGWYDDPARDSEGYD
jgi:hypothetical protein